jgi:hypothetical protein
MRSASQPGAAAQRVTMVRQRQARPTAVQSRTSEPLGGQRQATEVSAGETARREQHRAATQSQSEA